MLQTHTLHNSRCLETQRYAAQHTFRSNYASPAWGGLNFGQFAHMFAEIVPTSVELELNLAEFGHH